MFGNVFLPVCIAFAVTALAGPLVIPVLRRQKIGNTEREELASHQVKNGTPSMGGILILAGFLAGSVFFLRQDARILSVIVLTLGFGLIGLLDDAIKAHLHRSDGLIAWQKLLLEILVTLAFALMIYRDPSSMTLRIPFAPHLLLDPGVLGLPLLFFVVLGTVNGVNFTDGLDGLASSVTAVVAAFFIAVCIKEQTGATPAASAMLGALCGYLLYNVHPASIFMGDTGSLALGGFVAAMAYILHMPLFLLIIGAVYVVEVLSVILQVGYFKMTHGKRIFRMAPIHHHFELGGWSETRVVAVFTIVTVLLCLLALCAV